MSTDAGEAALVAAARAGSSQAFGVLVGRHQQAVRAFLRRFCGDWDAADDLAQEAMTAAWFQLAGFKGQASFRSWVCGIGYRKALTAGRSRSRALAREAGAPEPGPGVRAHELRLDLERALAGLPEAQRAALALCLAAGFTHEEAAAALDLPLGTVKSHVLRGRERLKQMLGGSDGG